MARPATSKIPEPDVANGARTPHGANQRLQRNQRYLRLPLDKTRCRSFRARRWTNRDVPRGAMAWLRLARFDPINKGPRVVTEPCSA